MLDAIINGLTAHVTGIVVSIIGIVLARYAKKLMNTIETKFHIDIDDKVEKMLMHLVRKAVRAVYQTFVKEQRKLNAWNDVTKIEALHKAYDLVSLEAKRIGLNDYIGKKDILADIESELVKIKDKSKTRS